MCVAVLLDVGIAQVNLGTAVGNDKYVLVTLLCFGKSPTMSNATKPGGHDAGKICSSSQLLYSGLLFEQLGYVLTLCLTSVAM